MTDVGIGQLDTLTGKYRHYELFNAVMDTHPALAAMNKHGGVKDISGGRTFVVEMLSGQNTSVGWVGKSGTVSLGQENHADAPEFAWKYLLGSLVYNIADTLQNQGDKKTQFINLVKSKRMALEASVKNELHAGFLSAGAAANQLVGLGALVSTTPTSGSVGGIDTSDADAAWFANGKFDTSADWSDGAADAGNIKRILDKGINTTNVAKMEGKGLTGGSGLTCGLIGETWFEYLTQATQAIQVINDNDKEAKVGFQKIVYRGVPMYLSGGLTYSSNSQQTATRAYLLDLADGGVNLVFHKDAKFKMLDEIQANNQAVVSRLMFTMVTASVGRRAANWVAFD